MLMPFFWFLLTGALYLGADRLYRRFGAHPLLHPVLLPSLTLMSLFYFDLFPLEDFEQGTRPYGLLLTAAVGALSLPLFRHIAIIRRDPLAVIVSLLAGSIMGAGTAVACGAFFSLPDDMLASLSVKSITTPIAVEVAREMGGVPPVVAITVVVSGLFVAVAGPPVLRIVGVCDEVAVGLSLGTAGHGLGTAEAFRLSDVMGAASAFAMAANGLLTALLLPLVWV